MFYKIKALFKKLAEKKLWPSLFSNSFALEDSNVIKGECPAEVASNKFFKNFKGAYLLNICKQLLLFLSIVKTHLNWTKAMLPSLV